MDWDGEHDLTADEADGYLRGYDYQYNRTNAGGLLVRKGDGSHTFVIDGELNLTEALNSACRAVRSKG